MDYKAILHFIVNISDPQFSNKVYNEIKPFLSEQDIFLYESFTKEKNKDVPQYIGVAQNELKSCIKKYDHLAISAPTSFGKTKTIIEYIVNSSAKSLIICPTIALNSEYYSSFGREGISAKTSPINAKDAKVIILTPERASALFELFPTIKFDLIVFDEFYEAFSKNLRHFNFINVLKQSINKSQKIVVIAPADSIMPKEIIDKRFVYKQFTEKATARKQFSYCFNQGKEEFEIYVKNDAFYDGDGFGFFSGFEKMPKNEYVLEAQIKKLIFGKHLNEQNMILVRFPKQMPKLLNYMIADFESLTEKEMNETIWLRLAVEYAKENFSNTIMLDGLQKGICYHNGKVDKFLRWLIEKAYQKKEIKFIIANSTLTKGVNLAPDNMFILSMSNPDNVMKRIENINAIGRVGRIKANNIGNIYWLFKQKTSVVAKSAKDNTISNVNIIQMPEIDNDKIPSNMEELYGYFNKNIDSLSKNKLTELQHGINLYLQKKLIKECYGGKLFDLILKLFHHKMSEKQIGLYKYYFDCHLKQLGYSKIFHNALEKNVKVNEKGKFSSDSGKNINLMEAYVRDKFLFDIVNLYDTQIGYYFIQIVENLIKKMVVLGIVEDHLYKEFIKQQVEIDSLADKYGWSTLLLEQYLLRGKTDKAKKELDKLSRLDKRKV